ncbi:MAG: hypothetical protein DRG11_06280 [Epsilonproteobacteria bacterium]|nr:MAG: hypothetical protein DRG11_06280 [Campylobacterota bacterium]
MTIDNQPILSQYKIFCETNKPKTQQIAVEYFAIFGGLDICIDTDMPIYDLIQKHILKKYKSLRYDINKLTHDEASYSSILTALALGDRRTNSAFKHTKVSFDHGIKIVDELCDLKVLKLEKSLQKFSGIDDQYTVSEKLIFISPFVRFWFAFVSPIFKGIRDGDFDEFRTRYDNRKSVWSYFVFEQLCFEYIRYNIGEKNIKQIGRYWDDDISIDMLVKTKDGKTIAGCCKYTNSKIKKSELTLLKERCEKLRIDVDVYVLFSKKGFTTELKSLRGEELKLFTVKNFVQMI